MTQPDEHESAAFVSFRTYMQVVWDVGDSD